LVQYKLLPTIVKHISLKVEMGFCSFRLNENETLHVAETVECV